MKYINFPKNKQTEFLRLIKGKTNYSWKQLAYFLNVNRSMIFFYLNEHSKLPYTHYLKLCNLARIKENQRINLIDIKNKEEEIKKPALSPKLAEFVGALNGDGHMNMITYEVSISMDKDLDNNYSNYIIALYKELFDLKARKYTQEDNNKVKCFVYSKQLVRFLYQEFNVPTGKKKGYLQIPTKLKQNKNLLKAYIRGLFDTDGTFHRHHKKDCMLGIISTDKKFIKELKVALESLNFITSLKNKNLYIYRKEHIDRFFKEINPSNKKHTDKYFYYQKYGVVPLTKELLNR